VIRVDFREDEALCDAFGAWPPGRVAWWLVSALDSCREPSTTSTAAGWLERGARVVPGDGVGLNVVTMST
jgi:hypothetical protein